MDVLKFIQNEKEDCPVQRERDTDRREYFQEKRDESLIERAKSLSFEERRCQVEQETKH